ncbi:MAG: hypothetical protein U0835_03065 [Isosphaeraceae bacterium]
MGRSARGHLAGPWVGALLALLTSGIVLPRSAQAGCAAHYIHTSESAAGSPQGLELLGLAGVIPSPPGEAPRERPTPCSGALCSGNPAPPSSAIPLAPPPWSGQWALPAFLSQLTGPGSYACAFLPERPRPVDHACPVFRPPRPPFTF